MELGGGGPGGRFPDEQVHAVGQVLGGCTTTGHVREPGGQEMGVGVGGATARERSGDVRGERGPEGIESPSAT